MQNSSPTSSSQPQPQPCFDCGSPSDPTLLGYYQICLPCYQTQVKSILQYKASRTTFHPSIDQILPYLFLGNEDAACNQTLLQTYQIKAILVCGSHLDSPFEKGEGSIEYKKFLIADDPKQKILGLLGEAYEWIERWRAVEGEEGEGEGKGKGGVLVHCAAGVSRSAAFVISYLMRKEKMRYKEAYEFVKARRGCVHPNGGFVQALEKYERYLFEGKEGDKQEEEGKKE